MNTLAGIFAIVTGVLAATFALMILASQGNNVTSLLIAFFVSAAFLISGILGVMGRHLSLTAGVWSFALVSFVIVVFLSGADGGLMDGGVVILAIFLYLAAGTAISVIGWRRARHLQTNT